MGSRTGIAWCDSTFNPWHGCLKVSPACDHCYAERAAARYAPGVKLWGEGSTRRTFGLKHWHEPVRWNARAFRDDVRLRVFCASMADVFDKDAPGPERDRLWRLIEATPALDWLLLTKRVGNVARMFPASWLAKPRPNVWLGISVIDQGEAERDVPKLAALPAVVRFLSCEPLLGPIDLGAVRGADALDWLIVGGESGPHARSMSWAWVRDLNRCASSSGLAFFVKQGSQADHREFRELEDFPPDLRVREFPRPRRPDQWARGAA